MRSRFRLNLPGRLTARERYATSVIFLFMLMVPWLLLAWPPVARHLQVWWVDALVRAGVIVLTALVTGAILARTKTFEGAITPAAFADAFVRLGIGWSLFGILVLVTGRVPSKYVHRSIPRMASLTYFGIGALLALVGALFAKFRKPDTHRGTSSARPLTRGPETTLIQRLRGGESPFRCAFVAWSAEHLEGGCVMGEGTHGVGETPEPLEQEVDAIHTTWGERMGRQMPKVIGGVVLLLGVVRIVQAIANRRNTPDTHPLDPQFD